MEEENGQLCPPHRRTNNTSDHDQPQLKASPANEAARRKMLERQVMAYLIEQRRKAEAKQAEEEIDDDQDDGYEEVIFDPAKAQEDYFKPKSASPLPPPLPPLNKAQRRKSNSDTDLYIMDENKEIELCSKVRPFTDISSKAEEVSVLDRINQSWRPERRNITFDSLQPEQGFYRVYDDLSRIREWDLIPYVLASRKRREEQRRLQEQELKKETHLNHDKSLKSSGSSTSSGCSVDSGRASVVSGLSSNTGAIPRTKRANSHSDAGSNCSADSGTYHVFDSDRASLRSTTTKTKDVLCQVSSHLASIAPTISADHEMEHDVLEELSLRSVSSLSTSVLSTSSVSSLQETVREKSLNLSPAFLRDHKATPVLQRKSNLQQQIKACQKPDLVGSHLNRSKESDDDEDGDGDDKKGRRRRRDLLPSKETALNPPRQSAVDSSDSGSEKSCSVISKEVNGFSSKAASSVCDPTTSSGGGGRSSSCSPPPPPLPPRLKRSSPPPVQPQAKPKPVHSRPGKNKDLSSYFGLLTEDPKRAEVSKEVVQAVARQSLNLSPAHQKQPSPPGRKDLHKFLGIQEQLKRDNKADNSQVKTSMPSSYAMKQQPGTQLNDAVLQDEGGKTFESSHSRQQQSSPTAVSRSSPCSTPKSRRRSVATRLFRNPLRSQERGRQVARNRRRSAPPPHSRAGGDNHTELPPTAAAATSRAVRELRSSSAARTPSPYRLRTTPLRRVKSKEFTPRKSFLASLMLSASASKGIRKKQKQQQQQQQQQGVLLCDPVDVDKAVGCSCSAKTTSSSSISSAKSGYSANVKQALKDGLPVIPFFHSNGQCNPKQQQQQRLRQRRHTSSNNNNNESSAKDSPQSGPDAKDSNASSQKQPFGGARRSLFGLGDVKDEPFHNDSPCVTPPPPVARRQPSSLYLCMSSTKKHDKATVASLFPANFPAPSAVKKGKVIHCQSCTCDLVSPPTMSNTFPHRRRPPLLDNEELLRFFEQELEYVDMDKENRGPPDSSSGSKRWRRKSIGSLIQSPKI